MGDGSDASIRIINVSYIKARDGGEFKTRRLID